MQDFQNLIVWQRARVLALAVDSVIQRLARGQSIALKGQLGRAADSISANIAEGSAAASQREFARYLDIAIKSCSEVQHHILAARDRRLVREVVADGLADEVVQIRRMLYVLRRRVLEQHSAAGGKSRRSVNRD